MFNRPRQLSYVLDGKGKLDAMAEIIVKNYIVKERTKKDMEIRNKTTVNYMDYIRFYLNVTFLKERNYQLKRVRRKATHFFTPSVFV